MATRSSILLSNALGRAGLMLLVTARAMAQEAAPAEQPSAAAANGAPSVADGDDEEPETELQSIPGDPFGDSGPTAPIALRALFQARYASTFAARSSSERASYRVREEFLAQRNDGFSLNRLFLRVGSDPNPYLGFKTLLDFAELLADDPEDMVKQAYVALRPLAERLEIVAGLFKLPFSVIELDASSRFEFSDFGAFNRLTGELGYGGRDVGVQLRAAPLKKPKRLRLSIGAFRGRAHGEHDSPVGIVGGRVESKPNKRLRFGADIVQHTTTVTYNRPFNTSDRDELPNPPNPLYPAQRRWEKGRAVSADARYKRKGIMLRGEAAYGDRVDVDTRYGAGSFWAAWALASYRVKLGSVRLLPAVRYEFLDSDREHDDRGAHHQYFAALNVLFWDRFRFVFDVAYTDVQENTALLNQPRPLQIDPYLALDQLRITGQLQAEL